MRFPDTELMGGYWSGRNGAYGKNAAKPLPGIPDLIAQHDGWLMFYNPDDANNY
jgi:hypothetical protein